MAKTPEGHIKSDVDALLKQRGCYNDTRTSTGYGRKGVPDRTGCYRGFYYAIEIKELDTMEPTAWQAREMRKIREAGGYAICVGAPTHFAVLNTFFNEIDAKADLLLKALRP